MCRKSAFFGLNNINALLYPVKCRGNGAPDPGSVTVLMLNSPTEPYGGCILPLHAFQVQHEEIQPRRHVHIQTIATDATVSIQNLKLDRDIRRGASARKNDSICAYFGGLCQYLLNNL